MSNPMFGAIFYEFTLNVFTSIICTKALQEIPGFYFHRDVKLLKVLEYLVF